MHDNKAKLVELPGCLKKMLEEVLIPNAKQDMSSLFREELAKDNDVQAVFAEYREKLRFYYNEATLLTSTKGKQENKVRVCLRSSLPPPTSLSLGNAAALPPHSLHLAPANPGLLMLQTVCPSNASSHHTDRRPPVAAAA